MKEVHTINYYSINEGAARRAKEMNSFSDYKEGSATAEYRAMVDKAAAIAEQQKSRVDPMYHEKIDHLLDTYARKLAENMNQGFAIDARVPSVMIAGPANFPVGKKEKQNRARDSNMEEWRYIQGLLDKIRTEKGEFNRWIRATNAVIRDIKKKIALLFDWIAEAKAELAKPQAPDLVSLLNAYYTQRRAGAYSQKGKVSNLKEMNETFNYLRANGIYTLEDLESRVSEHSAATESLKKTLDEQTARMKAIKQLYDSSAAFQSLKPVYDGLQKIKFEKPRAKYKAEHEAELIQFYAARRIYRQPRRNDGGK